MNVKLLKRMRKRLIIIPTGIPKGTFYTVFTKDFKRQGQCDSALEIVSSFGVVLDVGVGTWLYFMRRQRIRMNKKDFKQLSA